MKRVSAFVVKNRIVFAAVFIALMVFSCFSMSWVNVEDDITYYLPDSAEAKSALTLMNREFVTYASADVMVENITTEQAEELYDDISTLDGVLSVTFDTTENHYKDDCALYTIMFSGTATDETALNALAGVKDLLGSYKYSFYSDSFTDLATMLSEEMSHILVIVVIVVIGVLIFTSTSYLEPLVMLGTFIVAAVINLGTNFIFGTISFVSNSVAIVMQLALSVDYAIIYSNRYKEEHSTKSIKEAAIDALTLSIPEITASSLTTIAGLVAITFMQFKLGLDMGLALVKAIFISLVTVFCFMPALVVGLGNAMDKTRHRNFVPKISFIGKFAYITRYVMPLLFLGLVIFAYISFGNVKYAYSDTLVETAHKSESDVALENIQSHFGTSNMLAVILPSSDYEKEAAYVEDLKACPEVKDVTALSTIEVMDGYTLGSRIDYEQFMQLADVDETVAQALFAYYAAGINDTEAVEADLNNYTAPLVDLFLSVHELAESGAVELDASQTELIDSLYSQLSMAQKQLRSDNYSRIIVYINLPEQSDETFEFVDKMHVMATKYYPDGVLMTGNTISAIGFADTFGSDINTVGLLSICLVIAILFFTFKSIGMPILLIIVIQGSIWINFAIAYWTGKYVFFMCYLIVSSIQMGANIDYAIVISSRYTQLRDAGVEKRAAIIDTLNFAFPTVITSGTMMVVAGLLIGWNVSEPVIAGMGYYVGTGTIITLFLVNFVLPQILVFGDGVVRATSVHVNVPASVRRTLHVASVVLLAASVIVTFVITPGIVSSLSEAINGTKKEYNEFLDTISELKVLADDFESIDKSSAQYDFAESLLTDKIGTEQYEEGEEQYNEGKATLDGYKEQYNTGKQQYLEGLNQYNEGAEQLREGQSEYDSGVAQLAEAKEQYAEGEAKLAAGKAEYEAGKQQYDEGKQQYDDSKAQLDEVKPLVDAIEPLYNNYLNLQSQYDEAVNSGDTIKAAGINLRLELARSAFETELGTTGYTVEGLLEAYYSAQDQLAAAEQQLAEGQAQLDAAQAEIDAGQAQLDEAAVQIAEAEKQLAQGKKELDAGYSQLDDAKQELDDAEEQLDSGKEQIDEGQKQLDEGLAQLDEGKKTLEENKIVLENSIDELASIADDDERLKEGIAIFNSYDGISALTGVDPSYSEICSAAESYFNSQLENLNEETKDAVTSISLLMISAICAAVAAILALFKKMRASAVVTLASIGFALVCATLWNNNGLFGNLPWIAAICIMITAILFIICTAISNQSNQDEAVEA